MWLYIICTILSTLLVWLFKHFAVKKSLIDIPNERSSHTIPTPRGGGIAISATWFIVISVLFYRNEIHSDIYYALLCGLPISLIGIIDDRYTIAAVYRFIIPRLLEYFKNNNIHATFAAVGFIFFKDKEQLNSFLPELIPEYSNKANSSYVYLKNNEIAKNQNIYFFAPELIQQIIDTPGQELGAHTFSHYYCLEDGQTIESFSADIKQAKYAAKKLFNVEFSSLIFPRNQLNNNYLSVCKENGIICIRGNEQSWIYKPQKRAKETKLRRALRLIDAYLNLTGHNCVSDAFIQSKFPLNIQSSRFLRPYSKQLRFFEPLRLRRIKSGMTYAAKNGLTYHLWWHPHNFGKNTDLNFDFLGKIIEHFKMLNQKYNFASYHMSELANELMSDTKCD